MSSITGVWLESSGNQNYSHRYLERLENAALQKFIKKCNLRVFLLDERINRIKIRGSLASGRSVAEQKICRKKGGIVGHKRERKTVSWKKSYTKGRKGRKEERRSTLFGRPLKMPGKTNFFLPWCLGCCRYDSEICNLQCDIIYQVLIDHFGNNNTKIRQFPFSVQRQRYWFIVD